MSNRAEDRLAIQKFSVGQPVRRAEDVRLVSGRGQYTDDVNRPGQAHAAFVRSQVAHGIIKGLDTEAARRMPGVIAVYTGKDIASAGYGGIPYRLPLKNRDGSEPRAPKRLALHEDKVRYVGDPIACVIAETAEQAQDAAEAIVPDIEPLPAVLTPGAGVAAGAPEVYAQTPGNIVLDYQYGDPAKVDEAIAAAHHVTRLRLSNARLVVNAMEPRAVVAEHDRASGRFTLYAPTQGVIGSRASAAEILKVPAKDIRFLAVNVGGSFGMKGAIFPEYICALHAARELGRPVKWTATRSDSYIGDHHGRAQEFDCTLALDKDGRILALKLDGFGDLGAYLTNFGPVLSSFNVVKHVAGVYRTPLIAVHTRAVLTNTVPVTAYRGAGRPEGNYYMERLMDAAAAEMGIDPAEMRRRNHIKPSELPFKSASGSIYDSGDFPAVLDKALELADWSGFAGRAAESKARGRLRGRGIGQYLEVTAPVQKEQGSIHFGQDGTVTITTGTHDHGQGHWTPFAQILVDRLGVPFGSIKLRQTDSDILTSGGGTGGSKSLMSSGTALVEAAARVVEKGRQAASHLLEAAAQDIVFEGGRFGISGTDRSLSVIEVARRLMLSPGLPEGCPSSLDVDYVHEASPPTYPNGCNVAEVEIDPETGIVTVERYTMVGDFGTVVNPLIVEGQLQGGAVQGLGQCLMEIARYSEDGQLLSGSFMDYAMPRAADVPHMTFTSLPFPSKSNPLGAKGCGEAGVAGALTSIMNAIVDALRPYGVRHIEMPATPEAVWSLINRRS